MTLQATRDLLESERVWCVAARVALHDGEDAHHQMTDEGQMMVSVRTLRHDVQIWAILAGGGSADVGVWFIPPVGTEVIVNFDDGMFEGDAYIVGIHGKAPSDLAPGKVFIRGDVVNLANANEGPGPTSEGVVVGTGVDPFTGSTYNVLGNASTKVFAKK
jgi:hypothetical protein